MVQELGCETIKIQPDAVLNPFTVLKESDRTNRMGKPVESYYLPDSSN